MKVRPALVSNNADAVIALAEGGFGIGMSLSYQVERQLARRKLRLVLEDFEPEPLPVSALYPHGRLLPAKVREFVALARARLL